METSLLTTPRRRALDGLREASRLAPRRRRDRGGHGADVLEADAAFAAFALSAVDRARTVVVGGMVGGAAVQDEDLGALLQARDGG